MLTSGDYWIDKHGTIQVRISKSKNWRYEALLLIHELTEMFLCIDRGVSFKAVVGVAIGQCDGEPCIKVLVAARTADLAGKIPARFKGYAVAIDETGELRAPRPPTPPTRP